MAGLLSDKALKIVMDKCISELNNLANPLASFAWNYI